MSPLRAIVLPRPCSRVWLVLLGLTFVTFSLGEFGFAGEAAALVLLGIAGIKAQLVADRFMGLAEVTGLWRLIIPIYLIILVTGILLAFLPA